MQRPVVTANGIEWQRIPWGPADSWFTQSERLLLLFSNTDPRSLGEAYRLAQKMGYTRMFNTFRGYVQKLIDRGLIRYASRGYSGGRPARKYVLVEMTEFALMVASDPDFEDPDFKTPSYYRGITHWIHGKLRRDE